MTVSIGHGTGLASSIEAHTVYGIPLVPMTNLNPFNRPCRLCGDILCPRRRPWVHTRTCRLLGLDP